MKCDLCGRNLNEILQDNMSNDNEFIVCEDCNNDWKPTSIKQTLAKYEKITEDDVFNVLVQTNSDFMNPIGSVINLVNIASLLHTSKYQVKKYMDQLNEKGLVELKMVENWEEEEHFPPYWGYTLTEAGKETDQFKHAVETKDSIFAEMMKEKNNCEECGKKLSFDDDYQMKWGTCNEYCYGKMVGVYV